MALFKIFKGLSHSLGHSGSYTKSTKEGYAYFTPDDGRFYIDIENSDQSIVGINSSNGSNRICINEGSVAFNNLLILDCGTAKSDYNNTILPEDTEVISYVCGDSADMDNQDYIKMSCGDSTTSNNYIIYQCI